MMRETELTSVSKDCIPIIVSLTSFPQRINTVWMTIESIIRQNCKPEAIVLWLSRTQFPNEFEDLPLHLLKQIDNGLSIKFVDGDIRSYKKFYYAFHEYPNKLILTIDDDLLFPSYFLKSIYDCHKQNPRCIVASFGFEYEWDPSTSYLKMLKTELKLNNAKENYFFGSGGGTLLDTSAINYLDNIDTILSLCPTADDIYLNTLYKLAGYRTVFHMNNPLLSLTIKNDTKLISHNGNIGDPNSVNAKQFRQLLKYVLKLYGKNPFNYYENT